MSTGQYAAFGTTILLVGGSLLALFLNVYSPGASAISLVLSAVFWIGASIRAELPGGTSPANQMNAVAASFAAFGTIIGLQHGSCKISHFWQSTPACLALPQAMATPSLPPGLLAGS